jgi:hypothetical protein
MAILDTNISYPEIEQAAFWPFLNEAVEQLSPVEAAVHRAKEAINPTVLLLIDKCEALEGMNCDNPEEADDIRMQLYDARSAVRRCAEQAVDTLQHDLPKGPHKLGSTMYFVIDDPHAKTKPDSWLIMLEDTANVSFMEPRGLTGDDDFKLAGFEQHVRLIEDIIAESQSSDKA